MSPETKDEEKLQPPSCPEIIRTVLTTLRAIDRNILAGVPLKAALEDACRSLVEIFCLKLCWVGLLQEGSFEVAPAAYGGSEEGYLSAIRATYDGSERGDGPEGTAIKTRKLVIVNDLSGDPAFIPWRKEALMRGYRSSAAFPLFHEHKVVGVLNVYGAIPDYFDKERVELIQAFADQVALLVSTTQRKKASKETEARYLGLIEAANDAVVSVDKQGKIVLWNPAAERLFGHGAAEALSENFHTFIMPAKYRERALNAFGRAVKLGKLKLGPGQVIEAEGLRKDGTTFPIEHVVSMEKTASGIRFTTIIRDITKRKLAEEALKESEKMFKNLTEKSLVGVYLIQDEVYRYVNPRLAEIFGYAVKELLKEKVPRDLVLPEDWPVVEENIRKRISGEVESAHYAFRGVRKDKKVIQLEVHGSSTIYQGKPAVIGTLLDVPGPTSV